MAYVHVRVPGMYRYVALLASTSLASMATGEECAVRTLPWYLYHDTRYHGSTMVHVVYMRVVTFKVPNTTLPMGYCTMVPVRISVRFSVHMCALFQCDIAL